MMNRWHKDAVKALERCGYSYSRTNSKGHEIYENSGGDEVRVSKGMDETQCKALIRHAEVVSGQYAAKPGRNAKAVKARQAEEAQQLRDRLVELAELERQMKTPAVGADDHLQRRA